MTDPLEDSDWDEASPPPPSPIPFPAQPAPARPAKKYRDAPAVARKSREPRGRNQSEGEIYVPRTGPGAAPAGIGRTLPHSLEAEEYLLGCCLVDGQEIIPRALDAGVAPESFYDPKHGIVFGVLVDLFKRKEPVDAALLATELQRTKQLDQVGGMAFIVQVSSSTPTTAQAGYYIATVKQQALLRDIIRRGTDMVERCYTFSGDEDLSSIIEPVAKLPESLEQLSTPLELIARPLAEIPYPENDATVLLGTKHRWLCHGGAVLIPAPAGIGKSTLSYQAAACWGVGRDLLGINVPRPLRVIIVQAEDDDGDIGEVVESIKQGLKFTPAELELFRRNVFTIRDRVNTGDSFIVALRGYVRAFRPDLVILNPLLAYCPGLSKEEIAGPFLYGGLNGVAASAANPFGYVVFHHTPKPPAEQPVTRGQQRSVRSAVDRQYTAFGSSLLTNWARAIINIGAVRGQPGQFSFTFDKRGTRAGLTKRVEQGAAFRLEAVTDIRVQHSRSKIRIRDTDRNMILWERVNEGAESSPTSQFDTETDRPALASKLTQNFTREEMVKLFPAGYANRVSLHEIRKKASDTMLMSQTAFAQLRVNFLFEGVIKMADDGQYYRPQ